MAQGNRKKEILQPIVVAQNEKNGSLLPSFTGQSLATVGYSRVAQTGLSRLDAQRFSNIMAFDLPYNSYSQGFIGLKEPIELCQKAYFRVPVFKTSIDILTDLSNTEVKLKGGNAQSIKFFNAWLKKINIWKTKEQFFRECYRSGNIIFYRADSHLTGSDILKMGNNYTITEAKTYDIPAKYILMNPAQICVTGLGYNLPIYAKILNPFEMEQLKYSHDDADQEEYADLIKQVKAFTGSSTTDPILKLDREKLHVVFYQKQDYEPMAVPMGYCALDDINLKLEMRKSDAILNKLTEYSMLLVTMGAKEEEGGTNPIAFESLKQSFNNEKVGRVLVGDYTTQAEFVTPQIADLVSPTRYEEINANIANALTNIFFGESKFADSVNKIRALVKKVENAQSLFLTEFLNPEIKRISKILNFKSYPQAVMEPLRLEDQTNAQRVYAQLLQMGVLTPKDGLELFDTGIMPDYPTLEENQVEFKAQKDKGYFQPPMGGAYDALKLAKVTGAMQQAASPSGGPGGRPSGTKAPQTTKKVSQTGASFSQQQFAKNLNDFYNIKETFTKEYQKANKIKKIGEQDSFIIDSYFKILASKEKPENWLSKTKEYLSVQQSDLLLDDTDLEIASISEDYEVDTPTAIAMFHAKN